MPKKKMLWRDIRATFNKSKGRFISIVCLIALGSFALVGLKVAGPDMRATGGEYFSSYDMADLVVIGDLGIDSSDEADIEQASGIREVEYGYLKDVTVKGTNDAIRVESSADKVSRYELVDGRMPRTDNEIAVDGFSADKYPVGSKISFTEKAGAGGSKVLKRHTFKVVGHVNSMDIIASINKGKTTVGTGDLASYAVVAPQVFDCDYHMVARITFKDTEGLDPYSDAYLKKVTKHKKELDRLLKGASGRRLSVVRSQFDDQIESGQDKVDDAREQLSTAKSKLDDAATQLDAARSAIADSEEQLASAASQLANGQSRLDASWQKLVSAKSTLDAGKTTLSESEKKLASADQQLSQGWSQYQAKSSEYQQGESGYKEAKASYDQAVAAAPDQKKQLQAGVEQCKGTVEDCDAKISQIDTAAAQVEAAMQKIEHAEGFDPQNPGAEYLQLQSQAEQLDRQKQQLEVGRAQATAKQQELQQTLDGIDGQLAAAKSKLDALRSQLDAAKAQLAAYNKALTSKQAEYERGNASYQAGVATYNQGLASYYTGLSQWQRAASTLVSKTSAYKSASVKIETAKRELASKEGEYEDGLAAYTEKLPKAEKKIARAQSKLDDARAERDKVEKPSYSVDTRRETPGAEGYKTHDSVSEIVDSLADIFPYFLYLVAALVASTTMTRMVDEERINAGTLKALGYGDADIMKKFAVYGAAAGAIGSIIGIVFGHTLLPLIV